MVQQTNPGDQATNDWRHDLLAQVRTLILRADPAAVEEIKWRKPSNPDGVPVWSHGGMICTGESTGTRSS